MLAAPPKRCTLFWKVIVSLAIQRIFDRPRSLQLIYFRSFTGHGLCSVVQSVRLTNCVARHFINPTGPVIRFMIARNAGRVSFSRSDVSAARHTVECAAVEWLWRSFKGQSEYNIDCRSTFRKWWWWWWLPDQRISITLANQCNNMRLLIVADMTR